MAFFYPTESGKSIKIDTYTELCTYFDYKFILETIHDKPHRLTSLISRVSIDSSYLLNIIETTPEKLIEHTTYAAMFSLLSNSEAGEINDQARWYIKLEEFQNFLQELCSNYEDILIVIKSLTNDVSIPLNCKQAYELLLFCALFAFVDKSPTAADVAVLRAELKLNPKLIMQDARELQITESPTTLPYFLGQHSNHSLKLSFTVIHNIMDKPAIIQLEDCCLRRYLNAGEKMLAMTINGEVVTFIPRFCVAENQLILQEGNHVSSTGKESDSISLTSDTLVFLAESQYYGLMMADQKGIFLTDLLKKRYKGQVPMESVFWLRGDLNDYGYLTSHGVFLGLHQRNDWNNLLFFDISVGNGIAVSSTRKAIDATGAEKAENVADISCCGNRWIILRTDGTVSTDIGEISKPDFPARAICADDRGYWISTDKTLYRLGSKAATYGQPLLEIARSNDGRTVFGRSTDGSYLQLR